MNNTPEELYRDREKRISDSITLRKPDRVPIAPSFGFFPAKYAGMTIGEVMNDPEKLWKAHWKTLTELMPDMGNDPYGFNFLGPLLKTLDYKQLMWPGHGLTGDVTYQFVEGEYMMGDEYDYFIEDPTDFLMRRYWPRICGSLQGLAKLPSLHNIISYYMGIPKSLAQFSLPEVEEALEALKEAGRKSAQIVSYSKVFTEKAKEAGFPMQYGAVSQAPFDTLGDFMRGTRGIMLDMYRKPDMVVRACEKLLPFMIETAVEGMAVTGNKRIFIPIHKGIDVFMSTEQFRQFFWPTLKELMVELINRGMTPCPLWEVDCTSRFGDYQRHTGGKSMLRLRGNRYFCSEENSWRSRVHQGQCPSVVCWRRVPRKR